MADVFVHESSLENIADAIRAKNGSSDTYKPAEMADAITNLPSGGITPTGTKQISITSEGTTTEDVTNYASAEITVAIPEMDDYETALTALGVQSDLTSGITALTTYANETTGASDSTLSAAVGSLVSGYGGGGSGNWSYEQVTIGSNSVTNTDMAYHYFGHTSILAIMTTNADTYNQMQAVIELNSYNPQAGFALRYRNGSTSGVNIANSYDAVLVENTVYDVFYQD